MIDCESNVWSAVNAPTAAIAEGRPFSSPAHTADAKQVVHRPHQLLELTFHHLRRDRVAADALTQGLEGVVDRGQRVAQLIASIAKTVRRTEQGGANANRITGLWRSATPEAAGPFRSGPISTSAPPFSRNRKLRWAPSSWRAPIRYDRTKTCDLLTPSRVSTGSGSSTGSSQRFAHTGLALILCSKQRRPLCPDSTALYPSRPRFCTVLYRGRSAGTLQANGPRHHRPLAHCWNRAFRIRAAPVRPRGRRRCANPLRISTSSCSWIDPRRRQPAGASTSPPSS